MIIKLNLSVNCPCVSSQTSVVTFCSQIKLLPIPSLLFVSWLCRIIMANIYFFPGISVSLRVFQGDLDKVNLLSYYYSSLFFHRIERWKGWGGVGQAEQAHSLIISSKRSLLVRGFFLVKSHALHRVSMA